jgi:hypothetical protein
MTFDLLLKRWMQREQRAIIVKGKGCTWETANGLRDIWDGHALVFCLNNDNNPREATPDLHFDIHNPRHHVGIEMVPTMVHPTAIEFAHTVRFPIDAMPRRKFGCTTAYMLALTWLLLDTWPKATVYAPGCNYNSTPSERDRERESINYWVGRIEQKTKRQVQFEGHSRAVDRNDCAYHCGRAEEASGGAITSIQDEDYH